MVKLDGSSPRARGTRGHAYSDGLFPRFIPACAGNASARSVSTAVIPVHPRVRGERFTAGFEPYRQVGSSPRARGTRLATWQTDGCFRFIPACAGNAC